MRITGLLCVLFLTACKVQPNSSTQNVKELDIEKIQLSPDQAVVEFEWIHNTEQGFITKIKSVKKSGFGFNLEFNSDKSQEILSDSAVNVDSNLAIIQKIEVLNADQPMCKLVRILN